VWPGDFDLDLRRGERLTLAPSEVTLSLKTLSLVEWPLALPKFSLMKRGLPPDWRSGDVFKAIKAGG